MVNENRCSAILLTLALILNSFSPIVISANEISEETAYNLYYDFEDGTIPLSVNGDGADGLFIDDSELITGDGNTNKYLHHNVFEGDGAQVASITLDDVPDFVTETIIRFKWYPEQNSNGLGGITFSDDETVLLQLQNVAEGTYYNELKYVAGDAEPAEIDNTKVDFYGGGTESINERWYDVEVKFNFEDHTSDLLIVNPEGTEFSVADLAIPTTANVWNTVSLGWYGDGLATSEKLGIDNIAIQFIQNTTESEDELASEKGLEPETAELELAPTDLELEAAELEPEVSGNTNLTMASNITAFQALSIFDFAYDFEDSQNPFSMSGSGATSAFLSIGETGNSYWRYEASGGKDDNNSKLLLSKPNESYTSANISFDWWPERNRNGSNSYGYVTLADSSAGTLVQLRNAGGGYAKNALSFFEGLGETTTDISDSSKSDFWGGGTSLMSERWYHVDVTFDFSDHTAELVITNPEDTTKSFQISISDSATAIDDFRIGWSRATGTATDDQEVTSIDNISVNYYDADNDNAWNVLYDFEDKQLPQLTNTGGSTSAISTISNKYLYHNVPGNSGVNGEKIAVASFTAPDVLSEATIQFSWWPERNSGAFGGITLLDGDISLLQLQNVGAATEKTQLQFKAGAAEPVVIGDIEDFYGTGNSTLEERWYDVVVSIDYDNNKLSFTITNPDGVTYEQTDLAIPAEAMTIDSFAFGWYGNGTAVNERIAIDDFSAQFTLGSDVKIESVSTDPASITVLSSSQTDFTESFPTTGTIMTQGGASATVDLGTWTPDKAFASTGTETYTYTAPLILTGTDYENPKDLNAEIKVQYIDDVEAIDYDYFDDFEDNIWTATFIEPVGNNKVAPKFAHEEVDGNKYLKVIGDNGVPHQRTIGSLHTLVDTNYTYESATVTFDFMPINAAEFVDVTIFSSQKHNPVFALTYTSAGELKYFTDAAYSETDGFAGSIDRTNAVTLCSLDPETWLSVRIDLNFDINIAAISIYDQASGKLLATAGNISIDPEAININRIALAGQILETYEMGIDNVGVAHNEYQDDVIISISELEDVAVAKDDFEEYMQNGIPKTITAVVSNDQSKTVQLQLENWKCTSMFDKNAFGDYVWTADILPGEYTNSRNLNLTASLKMTYTEKRYAVSSQKTTVVEIQPGDESPVFPTTAQVLVSNGEIETMGIDALSWKEINNAVYPDDGERVYIYEALIEEDDLCSNKDGVTVQFRINYFSIGDNYYGNARLLEYLDRGVYAVPASTGSGILVSWRLLISEYNTDIAFNIYRNGNKINGSPISDVTNYVDSSGQPGDSYVVESVLNNETQKSEAFVALEDNYISIPLQVPEAMPSLNTKYGREFAAETIPMGEYEPFEAGVADVDGDGQYEILLKWMPSNSFDSGMSGNTSSSSPSFYDCIRMDGTVLWRLNLGYSSPSGNHWSPFLFYDLDQDGKAEFTITTTDGTRMYKPDENGIIDMTREDLVIATIGDPEMEGMNMQLDGMPNESAMLYVTTFDGLSGEVIDTIDFPVQTGSYSDWGDTSGNRANRYNVSLAYIPSDLNDPNCTTTIPAVCFNRGYYEKTSLSALTLREGKLTLEWSSVFEGGSDEAHKGNHHNRAGDVDNDGFDEIILGSLAIDHNGEVLWVKDGEDGISYTGHGDANHLTAMMSGSDQLYYFQPFEDTTSDYNFELVNASNGAQIAGQWFAPADTGRGIAANITPFPGFEYWAQVPSTESIGTQPSGAIYNINGYTIAETKPDGFPCAWRIYWDGDLLSELPDGASTSSTGTNNTIYKYNWEENTMEVIDQFEGTTTSNGTGKYPIISADILGDWREELVTRSADYRELRIYCTDIETDYKIYTLMHDPLYRNEVAVQNGTYNQPPAVSFYLGEDEAGRDRVLEGDLPTYNISYTSSPVEIAVTGVTLNKNTLTLNKGNEETLVATIVPADATSLGVIWSSSNETIVTVNNSGKLTALEAGTATITVTTVDGNKKAECVVTVTQGGISPTGVTLNKNTLTLNKGDEETLVATIVPADATSLGVIWSSSNEDIVAVNDNGKLTALEAGTAIITVTTIDGNKKAECVVTVISSSPSTPNEDSSTSDNTGDSSSGNTSGSTSDNTSGSTSGNTGNNSAPSETSTPQTILLEDELIALGVPLMSAGGVEISYDGNGYINGFPDGTVRPDESLTRGQMAVMLYLLVPDKENTGTVEVSFSDLDEDKYYYEAIMFFAGHGILSGYPDGTFKADNSITRAEAATILSSFIGENDEVETTLDFEDLSGHWAQDYVQKLIRSGCISGYPDGTFRPDDKITRAEIITLINKALSIDTKTLSQDVEIRFTDLNKSHWAYNDIISVAIPK